jgi:hypothetical protein
MPPRLAKNPSVPRLNSELILHCRLGVSRAARGLEEPVDAVETSLAENTIRVAMHPADKFAAMAAMIDGGATIDAVAMRFGTSERHVEQRLRLGKLAPELLDAYRNGDISLDVVTAFTLGANHAVQLAVWNQLEDHSYIQPHLPYTGFAVLVRIGVGFLLASLAQRAEQFLFDVPVIGRVIRKPVLLQVEIGPGHHDKHPL